MSAFVHEILGKAFTDTLSLLEDAYIETDYNIPLVFILSKGADP